MTKQLEGKRVLITGASRGIGRAIAIACAAEGAILVGVGFHRSRENADAVVSTIGASGAMTIEVDISDAASVDRAMAAFCERHGGIDVLVANAAMHVSGLLATSEIDALRQLVLTNVLGPIVCARAALPYMLKQKGGTIAFVGSVAASRPARGQAAYAATKTAVEGLTRAIAVEYARKGIRAVCIRPGAVSTDMLEATRSMAEDEITNRIPARRIADAVEIANVVTMLVSDNAAYVNGSIIDVDGGYAIG